MSVEDLSDTLAVVAGWDTPQPSEEVGLGLDDPRLPALGWRAIVAGEDAAEFADRAAPRPITPGASRSACRRAAAISCSAMPFPHEAMMDQLHGVDFDKGCYVGQEVVSRMEHRGTARTRIVPAVYEGGFAADLGVEVMAGEKLSGKTGTGANGRGLVMIRLDRAADALAAGQAIRCGRIPDHHREAGLCDIPVSRFAGGEEGLSSIVPADRPGDRISLVLCTRFRD